MLPDGAGNSWTTFSRTSSIFNPVFAEINGAWSAGKPIISSTSLITLWGSALGKSILFITGSISKLLSSARYTLAKVWASTPCTASITNIAPSHAANDRDTSYVKSTWPGVSIKCNKYVSPFFAV